MAVLEIIGQDKESGAKYLDVKGSIESHLEEVLVVFVEYAEETLLED